MSFLQKIFKTKDEPIKSYEDFWNWFKKNEKIFYKIVKEKGNVIEDFLNKILLKLNELKDGFFFLSGMYDDNTAELIFTADGIIKNIVFVEELVNSAPKIDGWKFTALKPALNINIEMEEYKFNQDNISFYSNDDSDYPDEIDLTLVHNDLDENNIDVINMGINIFLDNYIGELNFVTIIDNIEIIGKEKALKELIPIEKLKDYLIWREKEFIEKYHGVRYNTEKDNYFGLEGKLKNGYPLIGLINSDLLKWDCKASHPWIINIVLNFDGKNNNGMPNNRTYKLLNEFENEIMEELKDFEGYLNIGRQTGDNTREIYFASNDFRKPSKIIYKLQQKYSDKFEISYDIYKDKYWRTFNRFINTNI